MDHSFKASVKEQNDSQSLPQNLQHEFRVLVGDHSAQRVKIERWEMLDVHSKFQPSFRELCLKLLIYV